MLVVIFELKTRAGQWDEYLALAGKLKDAVQAVDGFIDIERFVSQRRAGWALSISSWRDEGAVRTWRTNAQHRRAQYQGRTAIFEDYRLRVGEITADSNPPQGLQPSAVSAGDLPGRRSRPVTLTELSATAGQHILAELQSDQPAARGLIEHDLFESLYNPGKFVLLAAFADARSAAAFLPPGNYRYRQAEILRDYTMSDRAEAPEFDLLRGNLGSSIEQHRT